MHAHIFEMDRELEDDFLGLFDEQAEVKKAVARINDAAQRGVRTIVDLTVLGLGRYVSMTKLVADQIDVSIVVATGLYPWNNLPTYFRLRGPGKLIEDGVDGMSDLLVRHLTVGIGDSGIKAGVLKCAADVPGVTEGVRRVLDSVALAHLETGAPIATHTDAKTRRALAQQEIFKQAEVDLGRVIIGHCGDSVDLVYLRSLRDAGSYLGMDRFGNELVLPLEQRIDTVVELCEEGWAERMVLSHDSSCFSHAFLPEDKARLLPLWSYSYIHDNVLPRLLERGLSMRHIDQMLVSNPAAILGRPADRV